MIRLQISNFPMKDKSIYNRHGHLLILPFQMSLEIITPF